MRKDLHETSTVRQSIGALVFAFQGLEYELHEILFIVMDAPTYEILNVLLQRVDFGRSLEVLSILANSKIKDEKLKKRLSVLVGKAKVFAKHRNKYLHSHYEWLEISFSAIKYERSNPRLSKMKKNEKVHEVFDPEIVYSIVKDIHKTTGQVSDLRNELMELLHPNSDEEEMCHDYSEVDLSREQLQKLFRGVKEFEEYRRSKD